jgi:hypothetical protein
MDGRRAALRPRSGAEPQQRGRPLGLRAGRRRIEVSVTTDRRPPGLSVYRRRHFDVTSRHGIPVTTPACTIIDLTPRHWPDLGLVVETDGLAYHRTPVQQAADRIRDQAHFKAGLEHLRFTHGQIAHTPAYVEEILSYSSSIVSASSPTSRKVV